MSFPLLYLSDQRTLFMGTPLDLGRHAVPASRLLICLKGELSYQPHGEGPPIPCTSLLLPAGLPVRVNAAQAVIADFYLDVCGFDYAVLRQQARRCDYGIYCDLRDEALLFETLESLRRRAAPADELWAQVAPLLNPPDLVATASFHIDPRVVTVVQTIKRTTRENLSLDDLADSVGVSSSRLISLFKQQVGIPIRRYRLWRRLHHAAYLLAAGCSLTEAAMGSGFADSAHFSRTFLEMLGFQPSTLTRGQSPVKILVTSSKSYESRPSAHSPERAASSFNPPA